MGLIIQSSSHHLGLHNHQAVKQQVSPADRPGLSAVPEAWFISSWAASPRLCSSYSRQSTHPIFTAYFRFRSTPGVGE
jgi:hypothetical protein